jgi:ferredoxin
MAFRIELDSEQCQGHGRCYALAPEVYGADDDGYCELLDPEPGPGLLEKARLGEMNCPEDALTVIEDG